MNEVNLSKLVELHDKLVDKALAKLELGIPITKGSRDDLGYGQVGGEVQEIERLSNLITSINYQRSQVNNFSNATVGVTV